MYFRWEIEFHICHDVKKPHCWLFHSVQSLLWALKPLLVVFGEQKRLLGMLVLCNRIIVSTQAMNGPPEVSYHGWEKLGNIQPSTCKSLMLNSLLVSTKRKLFWIRRRAVGKRQIFKRLTKYSRFAILKAAFDGNPDFFVLYRTFLLWRWPCWLTLLSDSVLSSWLLYRGISF